MSNMKNLLVLILFMNIRIVFCTDADVWGSDKVIWTKFKLIPKPILSNFTKSFHSAYHFKNTQTTAKPVISTKLNKDKPNNKIYSSGLKNVTNERKVPVDTITLSSKIVAFPQDRTVPTEKTILDAAARRRRRPVIRYEEEDESEEDDDDDDEESDIADELGVGDEYEEDDDDDEEVEEEEVPERVDVKHEYEDTSYVEPIVISKKKRKRKQSKKVLKLKQFKKLRKFMLPLLLAYKLKFFTLIPLLLGGLVLIVGTTGFAGFFFALFAVGLGLQKPHG